MTIDKNIYKQSFYVRIKTLIVQISCVSYSKFYSTLLNFKKVLISLCFNVMIDIEFELLNY